jgi:hypothetical protein
MLALWRQIISRLITTVATVIGPPPQISSW